MYIIGPPPGSSGSFLCGNYQFSAKICKTAVKNTQKTPKNTRGELSQIFPKSLFWGFLDSRIFKIFQKTHVFAHKRARFCGHFCAHFCARFLRHFSFFIWSPCLGFCGFLLWDIFCAQFVFILCSFCVHFLGGGARSGPRGGVPYLRPEPEGCYTSTSIITSIYF